MKYFLLLYQEDDLIQGGNRHTTPRRPPKGPEIRGLAVGVMVAALTQSLHLFRVTPDSIRKGKRRQTNRSKSDLQDLLTGLHTFSTQWWGKAHREVLIHFI